jgi:DAK2 domain fusion protein YloV
MSESLKVTEAGTQLEEHTRTRLIERYRAIDGRVLRKLSAAGLTWLRTNQQVVNSLNVFPVPDGDTGTNMVLTMQAAMDEIKSTNETAVGAVVHAIAHGALMGARGNSGVILSQLWRGFARSLDERELMDAAALVQALQEARDTAYKGVVRPVEGTILTVSKDMAAAARKALDQGIESTFEILERIVDAAEESVERTPDLLPVLKEAGVVDSGGKGLFFILEGMLRSIQQLPLDQALTTVQPLSALKLDNAMEAIEPGQDWEVVVDFQPHGPLDLPSFYSRLEELGTSIQVGEGDGIYRMHIHVPDETEYQPINYIRELGTIRNVSIENLMAQVNERGGEHDLSDLRLEPVETDQIATVAVAPGPGIARVFASLGVSAVVEGGQTMNPSTQEILAAFENLPTESIIILPNNKNVLLAAQQTAELTDKNVSVVPTVNVPQGITAMFNLDPEKELETVAAAMTESLEDVQCAELTTATRSVEIDGVQVQEGQVIALLNGKLASAGDDLEAVLMDVLERADKEQAEIITLYFGQDLSTRDANPLADKVREAMPDFEVEVIEGGQPHYQIILSIE